MSRHTTPVSFLFVLMTLVVAATSCKKESTNDAFVPPPEATKENSNLPGTGKIDSSGQTAEPGSTTGGTSGGSAGTNGTDGTNGTNGTTGSNGNTGTTGSTGSTGTTGSTGNTGNSGTTGQSGGDQNQNKKFPGDFPDVNTKQAQEIFTPVVFKDSLQMMTITKGGWLESVDGRTLCHIGAGRTFWSKKVPVIKSWPKGDEAYIEIDLDNAFYTDVYKYFDFTQKQMVTVGREGMSTINPCPIDRGTAIVHVYLNDFVSLTAGNSTAQLSAFQYVASNYSVQILVTNQTTVLSSFYPKAGQQDQSGARGCTIPAKAVFAVVYKVGQGGEGATSVPVEILSDIAGATGDLCKAGSMGYLPTAAASRML